jgi:hypothetical protein
MAPKGVGWGKTWRTCIAIDPGDLAAAAQAAAHGSAQPAHANASTWMGLAVYSSLADTRCELPCEASLVARPYDLRCTRVCMMMQTWLGWCVVCWQNMHQLPAACGLSGMVGNRRIYPCDEATIYTCRDSTFGSGTLKRLPTLPGPSTLPKFATPTGMCMVHGTQQVSRSVLHSYKDAASVPLASRTHRILCAYSLCPSRAAVAYAWTAAVCSLFARWAAQAVVPLS